MNSCEYVDKIIDYRMGQLTEEQKRELELHLKSCTVCQREMIIELLVEDELAVELEPGFIENKTMARLPLRQAQDLRSFWLYAYRMVVLGMTAAIVCFVLLPFLLKFPLKPFPDLSRYTSGLGEFLSVLAPANPILVTIGFCYILLIASSVYSLVHSRH